MIDATRIGIRRCPITTHAHRALDLPRPWSNKTLARHGGEGVNDRARRYVSRETKLFGIKAACRFHWYGHGRVHRAGALSMKNSLCFADPMWPHAFRPNPSTYSGPRSA